MNPTLTIEPNKVIESGDIALVTGDWSLTGKGSDGDVKMSGTYADVMRRQADGSWLFAIDNPDGVA
jgi:ketosteroid isomerase-like protein